jgi:hypothetical protein
LFRTVNAMFCHVHQGLVFRLYALARIIQAAATRRNKMEET